jgi:hypothetical protein
VVKAAQILICGLLVGGAVWSAESQESVAKENSIGVRYPNLFVELLGLTETQVNERLESVFRQLFYGMTKPNECTIRLGMIWLISRIF